MQIKDLFTFASSTLKFMSILIHIIRNNFNRKRKKSTNTLIFSLCVLIEKKHLKALISRLLIFTDLPSNNIMLKGSKATILSFN